MDELDILFLLDANHKIESRLNLCLTYFGLRLPQYRVLEVLDKCGKITVSDLSRKLGLSRATISVVITKLLEARALESIENSMDKRSFYLQMTNAGRTRFVGAENAVRMVLQSLEKAFDQQTIAVINEFSRQVMKSRLD